MRKTLFGAIATEDLEVIPSEEQDFDNGEDVLAKNFLEFKELHNELDHSLTTQEIIQSVVSDIDPETVTTESIAVAKNFICKVLEANNFSQKPYLSMESISDPKLALEAINKENDGFFRKFITGFKNAFLILGDSASHTFEIMSGLKDRIEKSERSLRNAGNNKVEITIPNNIYMRYGEDGTQVKNAGDFIHKLELSCNSLVDVLKETNDYVEHSFMKSIEAYLRTFDEDFLFEEFDKLESFINKIESRLKMTSVSKKMGVETFLSEVHLGMWRVISTKPIVNDFSRRDFKKIKAAVFRTTLLIQRTSDVGTNHGTVSFEVDKKFGLEVLNCAMRIDEEYQKFLKISLKLADVFTGVNIVSTFASTPLSLHASFTGAGRILLVQNSMLNNITPTVFYLAKNLNKHAVMIAEKVEKELSR